MISVEDRALALDLITRADDCATRRDAAGYVALFTPDAVMSGGKGEHVGTDAIRAAVIQVWSGEADGTRHLTVAPIVSQDARGGVQVASTLLLIVAEPLALISMAAIHQTLARTPDGWRIASRSIS